MSTTTASGRFSTAADEETIAATLAALDEHGITAEAVDDFDSARQASSIGYRPEPP